MTSDTPVLFEQNALVEDPEAAEAASQTLQRISFLWANRDSIPGAWMAFGGKRPEPSRNDPFKPVGEWWSLEQLLWTEESSEITWWAGHPHPTVRRIVASHQTCPPDDLDRLAEDTWVEIRQAALGNMATDNETLRRAATREPVEWLREAAGHRDGAVLGRCGLCGRALKRPDRFLTCSINCSITQAKERIAEGTYTRGYGIMRWPSEYVWSVADREAPGGVPGSGPKFRGVLISFIPGLNAVEATTALQGLVEREGLDQQEAVTAIDRMAQTMTGQAILDACLP